MSFSQTNTSREAQNRKILEELQIKKQMLLKQGVAQTLGPSLTNTPTPTPSTSGTSTSGAESLQRTALINAHASSTGYFITQDSSFGNLILPVLPRFDK